MAGDGWVTFKKHIGESLKEAGGPGTIQTYFCVASIPTTFAILRLGGGTPETSGVALLCYAGFISSAFTVLQQIKEIAKLPKEETVTKSA